MELELKEKIQEIIKDVLEGKYGTKHRAELILRLEYIKVLLSREEKEEV